jgi:hypothetical protein
MKRIVPLYHKIVTRVSCVHCCHYIHSGCLDIYIGVKIIYIMKIMNLNLPKRPTILNDGSRIIDRYSKIYSSLVIAVVTLNS